MKVDGNNTIHLLEKLEAKEEKEKEKEEESARIMSGRRRKNVSEKSGAKALIFWLIRDGLWFFRRVNQSCGLR
jgi:hypothetical protein